MTTEAQYLDFYKQHVSDLTEKYGRYMGWCPFHADSDSKLKGFSLDPETGLWNCFSGCGAGNAITFCQKKGMDISKAPDYDPNFNRYSYGQGVYRKKPSKKLRERGQTDKWIGTVGGLDGVKPYNHLDIDRARGWGRTLWICEGEKDTLSITEAGGLAIGIPSATNDKVLDTVSLWGIPDVIIACDNDEAGQKATARILDRFPWALWVVWPEDKSEHFDVTDLKEEDPNDFIKTLRIWAVNSDPYENLYDTLSAKFERDMKRDPDALLGPTLKKFSSLAKNIDGVQPGFYVIGAETSFGKTSFLCNLTLDLLDSNPDLTGLYFTLDDSRDVILNRLLSIRTGIPINQVQKLKGLHGSVRHKPMIEDGYNYLMGLADRGRLFIRDASEIEGVSGLEIEIKRRMNKKLFVVVDALYNLDVDLEADQRRENIERANTLKALSTTYDIPILCTGELRKRDRSQNQDKAPTIHDLMETGKFAYNANLVLLLYPQKMEDYDNEDIEKPLFYMKYAKNKLSHYRGRDRLEFERTTSRLTEVRSE